MQFFILFYRYFLVCIGLLNLFSSTAFSFEEEKIKAILGYIQVQNSINEDIHERIKKAQDQDQDQNQKVNPNQMLLEEFFGPDFSTAVGKLSEPSRLLGTRMYVKQILINEQFWKIFQRFIRKLKKEKTIDTKEGEQAFFEILIREISFYILKNCATIELAFLDMLDMISIVLMESEIEGTLPEYLQALFSSPSPISLDSNKFSYLISRQKKSDFLLVKKIQELFSKENIKLGEYEENNAKKLVMKLAKVFSEEEVKQLFSKEKELKESFQQIEKFKLKNLKKSLQKNLTIIFKEELFNELAGVLGLKDELFKLNGSTSSNSEKIDIMFKKLKLLSIALNVEEMLFTPAKKMKLFTLILEGNQKNPQEILDALFSKKELSLLYSDKQGILDFVKKVINGKISLFKREIEKLLFQEKLLILGFLIDQEVMRISDLRELKFKAYQERLKSLSKKMNQDNNEFDGSTYLEYVPFKEFLETFKSKKLFQLSPAFEIPMFLEDFSSALKNISSKEELKGSDLLDKINLTAENIDIIIGSLTRESAKKIKNLSELKDCVYCCEILKEEHQKNGINDFFWKESDSPWSKSIIELEENNDAPKFLHEKLDLNMDKLDKKGENYIAEIRKIFFNSKSLKGGKKGIVPNADYFAINLKKLLIGRAKENNERQKEYEEKKQVKKEFSQRESQKNIKFESNFRDFKKFYGEVGNELENKIRVEKKYFLSKRSYKFYTEIKKKINGETAKLKKFDKNDLEKLLHEFDSKIFDNRRIKIVRFNEEGEVTKMDCVYRLDFHHKREPEKLDYSLNHHYIRHFKHAKFHCAHVFSKEDKDKLLK